MGMNGSGKTTTLECMEGFRKYDSGTVNLYGKMGIQLQLSSLPAYIKVNEAICLFAKWKRSNIDTTLLCTLGINKIGEKLYDELSAGQKRRVHLAIALMGNPDILFLDEPTADLDIKGKQSLHQIIHDLKKRGITILLSSHDMAEVENLCDRIGILHEGTLRFLGTAEELSSKINRPHKIKLLSELGEKEYSSTNLADTLLEILDTYKQKNIPIFDIQISRGTLEQNIFDLFKKEADIQ